MGDTWRKTLAQCHNLIEHFRNNPENIDKMENPRVGCFCLFLLL